MMIIDSVLVADRVAQPLMLGITFPCLYCGENIALTKGDAKALLLGYTEAWKCSHCGLQVHYEVTACQPSKS
jgi:transcription elongation factor Elf1